MAVMGPVIGTILAIALIFILGPTAGIVLLSIMFGMILSTFMRQKEIYNDLGLIKERLGIDEHDDFNMTDDEIEKELEQEQEHK
ncbi:hypothetical protein D3C72_2345330 [compost metagenome]